MSPGCDRRANVALGRAAGTWVRSGGVCAAGLSRDYITILPLDVPMLISACP